MDKECDTYPDFDGQAKNLANHCAQSSFFSLCERTVIHQFNSQTPQVSPANRA